MKKQIKQPKHEIVLGNERKETIYRYDVEAENWVYDWYVEEGFKRIWHDKEALFNYGVV